MLNFRKIPVILMGIDLKDEREYTIE